MTAKQKRIKEILSEMKESSLNQEAYIAEGEMGGAEEMQGQLDNLMFELDKLEAM